MRTQLGEKAFTVAWDAGRNMTPELVLANLESVPFLRPASTVLPSTSVVTAPTHAGLTPRQMDVLRLLTQGLTSAQIAQQLVINITTANFHVRSIYSKLGVNCRSAATRYAIEHHLV